MKRSSRFFCTSSLIAPAAISLVAGPVVAQTPEASCQAVEQTEGMRKQGKYREARARLLDCVNAACGGDVRRRCASTLQQLDAVTPSIVVRAEDANGNDVTDVAVKLGNEPLVSSLDGMAIPVDPGQHEFVFERPGGQPVTKKLTIRRGEKFRSIEVQLGESVGNTEDVGIEIDSDAGPGLSSERLALGLSLIGVGTAGLVGFTWLGLDARSGEDELKECRPGCSQGRVDGVEVRYVMANVSLGVGALALGAAAWVLFSAPSGGQPTEEVVEPSEDGLAVSAGPDGAFASFSGRF
jgi:hypothetical protein